MLNCQQTAKSIHAFFVSNQTVVSEETFSSMYQPCPTCIIHAHWRFFKTMWLRNASDAILCEQDRNCMAQYLAQVLQ